MPYPTFINRPSLRSTDVLPVRELKRTAPSGTSTTMPCVYFGLPGWVTDQGAAAALSGGAPRGKKRFNASPASNAAEASTKIHPLVVGDLVAGCADEALEGPALLGAGSRATSRAAIALASGSDQRLAGVAAMICASPSTAAVRGSFAKRSASCHGSIPRRARVERTVSIIPFASTPTSANKNPFKLEYCNVKTLVFATTYTDNFLFYLGVISAP